MAPMHMAKWHEGEPPMKLCTAKQVSLGNVGIRVVPQEAVPSKRWYRQSVVKKVLLLSLKILSIYSPRIRSYLTIDIV